MEETYEDRLDRYVELLLGSTNEAEALYFRNESYQASLHLAATIIIELENELTKINKRDSGAKKWESIITQLQSH